GSRVAGAALARPGRSRLAPCGVALLEERTYALRQLCALAAGDVHFDGGRHALIEAGARHAREQRLGRGQGGGRVPGEAVCEGERLLDDLAVRHDVVDEADSGGARRVDEAG